MSNLRVKGASFPQLKFIDSKEFPYVVRSIKNFNVKILAERRKKELPLRKISNGV